METAKTVKKYGSTYRMILAALNDPDPDRKQEAYEKRLTEMYNSEKYAEHNIYPTTNAEYIYAIIAMCLELKGSGLSDKEIIDTVNSGFSGRRNFFKYLIRCIDLLPNSCVKGLCQGDVSADTFCVGGYVPLTQTHDTERRVSADTSPCHNGSYSVIVNSVFLV